MLFLHLGNNVSVLSRDVIGIYDYEIFKQPVNQKFLQQEKTKRELVVDALSGKEPKALIITKEKIYLSVIMPETLKRRAELIFDIDEVME